MNFADKINQKSLTGASPGGKLGLKTNFINKYFKNTPTRIEGVGLYVIEKEISQRIKHAFNSSSEFVSIKTGGDYRWRRDGESHMLNPNTISKLQNSVRQESYSTYKEFSKLVNDQEEQLMTNNEQSSTKLRNV